MVLPVRLSLNKIRIPLFSIPVTSGCYASHMSLLWLLGSHSLGARLKTFSPSPPVTHGPTQLSLSQCLGSEDAP